MNSILQYLRLIVAVILTSMTVYYSIGANEQPGGINSLIIIHISIWFVLYPFFIKDKPSD